MAVNQKVKTFMNRISDAISEYDPKRVCVFKTGTYDVEIAMDGPNDATFASNFADLILAIPELDELAKLPITDCKYIGAASLYNDTHSLRINRRQGVGTLVVVLNADWRRDLLGVDYEDFREMSVGELFRKKYDGVKVFIDLKLQKDVLEHLLDASGGIPSTGLWLAGRYYDSFMVQWGVPNVDFHFRYFDCVTLFERMRDDEIEEIDYEG